MLTKKKYIINFILNKTISEQNIANTIQEIETILKELNFEVIKIDNLGNKTFERTRPKLKYNKEGFFIRITVETVQINNNILNTKFKLYPNVKRILIEKLK